MNWLQKISMGLWEDIEDSTRILKNPPEDHIANPAYYKDRKKFIDNYGWSIPERKSIDRIKSFVGNDKVLEIGSGRGTWAKLMQDAGIDIVATDISVLPSTYTQVLPLDSNDAVQQFGNHNILMMSWPPYDEPMAAQALKRFKGNKLIYIGEGSGGCTGDECLHNILNRNWHEIERIDIPRWPFISDALHLYIRI